MPTAQIIHTETAVAFWLAKGAPTPRPKNTPKKTGQPFGQPVKFSGGNAHDGRRFAMAVAKPLRANLRE